MYIIYLITNKINKKKYVGLTQRELSRRWIEHCCRANTQTKDYKFGRAIAKYGPDSFEIEVLETTDSLDEACDLERKWISNLQTYEDDFGYNLTLGGLVSIPTEETKEKIRRSKLGENNPNFGKTPSPEAIEKQRQKVLGVPRNGVSTNAMKQLRSMGFLHKDIAKILKCSTSCVQKRIRGWAGV